MRSDGGPPGLWRAVVLLVFGIGTAVVGVREYANDMPREDVVWFAFLAGVGIVIGAGWIWLAIRLGRRAGSRKKPDDFPRA